MSTSPPPTSVTKANPRPLAIDTLIRRELKIGDPYNAQMVAAALAERYQSLARAQAIASEAKGLPFLHAPVVRQADAARVPTASDVDLEQARHDVDVDMQQLVSDNLSKDIRPELEGWQQVIQRAIDEGVNAARYGLDPRKRDTAFAMRRQLGDYARLARLIGALTPGLNRSFRSLAVSLDEVSSVILVLMGESMANLGFSGGRFLLQSPYSELQARRDAVLNALRQIDGVSALTTTPGNWPRGLRAYRQLSSVLEASGQGELRSLMNEAELSRTLDELVQLASGGSASGLRAIGATAWAPLSRLHRFVNSTLGQIEPASHELATLQEALLLFIEGFVPAGGFRLLRVARPTVLNYGLYGSSSITRAERRLIELVNHRGAFARELDCVGQCGCDEATVQAQIVLDKVLYNVDRAIDYYCAGDSDLGVPEVRASAFAHLIAGLRTGPWQWKDDNGTEHTIAEAAYMKPGGPILCNAQLQGQLRALQGLLRPRNSGPYPARLWWDVSSDSYNDNLRDNRRWPAGSPTAQPFGQVLYDELCMQRHTDKEWSAVVVQMTAGCSLVHRVFHDAPPNDDPGCLPALVDRALYKIRCKLNQPVELVYPIVDPPMPRDIAVSLDELRARI